MRLSWAALGTVIAAASAMMVERDASACGGCFHEPPPPQAPNETPSMITGHRMILSISSKQTTLYDQIKYTGNPKTFAWVLPISGTAEIGLSADIVFATLGSMTENVVTAPPMNCPAPAPGSCYGGNGYGESSDTPRSPGASGGASADAGVSLPPEPPPVTVTKEETVGPYETVQLHSTDPQALNEWLSSHGFTIPADVKPIISQYVTEHFDFLAMKLVPGQGVQSMRPVRVTTAGASPVLPLRMVAAGTGATVGLTLWVVGEGRYEPQNFPFFKIDADELLWDWKASSSNFNALRAQKTAAAGGRGWEVENSTDLSTSQVIRTITYGNYPQYDAGTDYTGINGTDSGAAAESPGQVRADDVKALFEGIQGGTARVTRLRADLSHAALNVDLSLQASRDQSPLPLERRVTKEANEPTCPIYQGCKVVGQGPRSEAQASIKPTGTGSFSCSTTSTRASVGSTLALGTLATIIGLGALRTRRRRTKGGK